MFCPRVGLHVTARYSAPCFSFLIAAVQDITIHNQISYSSSSSPSLQDASHNMHFLLIQCRIQFRFLVLISFITNSFQYLFSTQSVLSFYPFILLHIHTSKTANILSFSFVSVYVAHPHSAILYAKHFASLFLYPSIHISLLFQLKTSSAITISVFVTHVLH